MRKHSTLWQSMLIPIDMPTDVRSNKHRISNHSPSGDEGHKQHPLASGSGFFVSDTLIVTNADVIKDAAIGTAQVVGKDKSMRLRKSPQ